MTITIPIILTVTPSLLCQEVLRVTLTVQAQSILYFRPDTGIYYAPVLLSYDIDITDCGSPDFVLFSDGVGGSFLYPQGRNMMIAVPVSDGFNAGTLVAALNYGDTIGATPTTLDPNYEWFGATTGTLDYSEIGVQANFGGPTYASGYFVGQASAYIGFDLVRGGQNYYGWMQVANPHSVNSGQIVDWAYETISNTPIMAGEVPEPDEFGMLALGAGLLMLRWKISHRFHSPRDLTLAHKSARD